MTIEELANTLENGFHDSEVDDVSVDFNARTAAFTLHVWIGAMFPQAERETYRKGKLVLTGLEYLSIEPPHSDYAYRHAGPIKIDLAAPDEQITNSRPHADGGFAGRFFVNDWNAFVHFAAAGAHLDWLESPTVR